MNTTEWISVGTGRPCASIRIMGPSKAVLCPYWRRTDYGMTMCEFTGDQSLNEYEADAGEKALDHFGSEERLHAHWTSIVLHDEVKCCGIHEEEPGLELHLAPAFLESLLAVLAEGDGDDDEFYRARGGRFLVNFLDIPGKPTDDEIGMRVRDYMAEWQGE